MTTSRHDSWLGEALASYQPTSVPSEHWDRLRRDAEALVAKIDPPNAERARKYLSRLATFLGDVVPLEPTAALSELMTTEHVQGYLQRRLDGGTKQGTVVNIQGTLNALLRAHHRTGPPLRQHERREHTAAYDIGDLRALAIDPDMSAEVRLVLLATIGGCELPVSSSAPRLELGDVRGGLEQAAVLLDLDPTSLPASTSLGARDVRAARAALRGAGLVLDVRRSHYTRVCLLALKVPAHALASLPGVGRRCLSRVAADSEPIGANEMRAWLRTPHGRHT